MIKLLITGINVCWLVLTVAKDDGLTATVAVGKAKTLDTSHAIMLLVQ
jgi:hypothetical protein